MTGPGTVAAPAPDRRRALGLLTLLALGAVGIGVAAVLLIPANSPAPPPGGPGTFATTQVSFLAAGEVIGVLAVGLLLLFLYIRFASPGGAVPKRFVTLILVYFLVALSFLAIVHLVGPGVVQTSGAGPPNGNTTGTPGNPGGPINGTLNNTTVAFPHYSISFWWAVGGALAISVAGLGLAVWLLGRSAGEVRSRTAPARGRVGEALEEALRSLDSAGDPRSVLIALYAQLLHRIGGSLPELEVATPREIERACVQELGIPPGPSAQLRELFERARYSTLPLDASDVEEARAALRSALDALRPAPTEPL